VSYDHLLAGAKAGMVFTDPPYNLKIDGHVSGLGKTRHREFAMASGEMDEAQFKRFLSQALEQLARNSKEGALLFCCMDWRHISEMVAAGRASHCKLINVCVWVKNNGGMGSFYRSQHEFVFVFKTGSASHRNNVQLGCHGRNRTNVWMYGGANDFGRGAGEGDLLALHPTPKPVAMVADAILDCTERGDIVLDGFLGSGSTLIAAQRTGRCCYGIEIDPVYVDAVVRRWQTMTGQPATCAPTGKIFTDRHAEMENRSGKQ
jgi:DNA modification methylase